MRGLCHTRGRSLQVEASLQLSIYSYATAKRSQVERHRAWAQAQVALAIDDGLYPDAERMKQLVRDCDTELDEMAQIDAYRRDAANAAHIQIAP
ncbi:MAG: hypothetical protein HY726_12015 [Candidatus Rokubacteria bacterium]|nr:hypothetical protein [Candidatus Rokubacteria bacterium]